MVLSVQVCVLCVRVRETRYVWPAQQCDQVLALKQLSLNATVTARQAHPHRLTLRPCGASEERPWWVGVLVNVGMKHNGRLV